MKPYIKDVIEGMEKGWEACPHQIFNKLVEGKPTEPTACCAVGHYFLGTTGEAKVDMSIKSDIWSLLCRVVTMNNEKGMKTLEIVEFLRKENE
jgi:hypothetical protein